MLTHKKNLYRDTPSKDSTKRFIVKENKRTGMDMIWHSKKLFGNWYIKNKKTKPFRDYHGNFRKD